MADNLDEVFGDDNLEAEVVADPAPDAQPEPVEAPIEPPAPAPEPVEPPKEQQAIPLATALQWRDEAKENRRRLEVFEAQQRQTAPKPDSFDDPEGFNAHVESRMDERVNALRFQMGEEMARTVHGNETVEAALTWAQQKAPQDQAFAIGYMQAPNPVDWIVRQHKRDALLSDIGDVSSVDDWFTREAAKRGYAPQSAPVTAAPTPVVAAAPQPASPPVRVPRSLATQGSGPSDIRHVATGPLAGVDAVFS